MKLSILVLIIIIGLGVFFIYQINNTVTQKYSHELSFVPVGDSYTIGTGVRSDEAWPSLLTLHLTTAGIPIKLTDNPAVSGWTTEDVIARELPIYKSHKPDLGTLLVGANDIVQGIDADDFRENYNFIVTEMLGAMAKRNLVLITIPDFTLTPAGSRLQPKQDVKETILIFNDIIKLIAKENDLPIVDLYKFSQNTKLNYSLTGSDGLHPSVKGHLKWEEEIFPAAFKLLK